MSAFDLREAVTTEILIARQIAIAARDLLPCLNGQGKRNDLAVALAHIALEHVASALLLFELGAIASGYALMRPALETTYKSIWIAEVADDVKVAQAFAGRDVYGDFKIVIREIQTKFASTDWAVLFGKIKKDIRVLHERTHSGGEQTSRRLKAQDVTRPDWDFSQIVMDIRTLGATSFLVSMPIITVDESTKLRELIVSKYPWLDNRRCA